jgi:hypothetical protein
MPYDDNAVYAKYIGAKSSENGDGGCCTSVEECSCCEPGTVGVFDENGKHLGCLTPNDAQEYANGIIEPPEGYVKVLDPNTGEYLGNLTPAQAIDYLNYLENGATGGAAANTFNIVNPEVGGTGWFELNFANAAGETGNIELEVDRIGLTDAITVSIQNSIQDIQFGGIGGTVTVIPVNDSTLTVSFAWTGAPDGVHTFMLRFAVNAIIKEVPVRLTLT